MARKKRELEENKQRDAKDWLAEIEQAEKDLKEYWERCDRIVKLYARAKDTASADRKFAMLWANTEVLKPAVYARPPQPVVTRRFSDKDSIGREVSEVLERTLSSIFDREDIDACLKAVRDDFLLCGRGTAWVRYVPHIEHVDYGDGEKVETLCDETIAFDFVHYRRFIYPLVKQWSDLPWIARLVDMDKESFVKRFDEDKYKAVRNAQEKRRGYGEEDPEKSNPQSLKVYEVWSKRDDRVLWLARDYNEFLDEAPPLYQIKDFWPCPRPAFGTLKTDSLVPIPDYVFYQDQAEEIDDLTKRIGLLSDALKLVGFYPAGGEGETSSAIERALSPSTQNMMIPVPAWAAFVKGGGAKQLIQWLPVEQVAGVIKACIDLRKQLIEDVYQITGISDIVRGESEASETATAQNIKAEWGSIRIRERQQEIARFARDLTRIAAEIVCEKFQDETFWKVSGLQYPTQEDKLQIKAKPVTLSNDEKRVMERPSQEEIVAILRDDCLRSYRVDIETDSTIAANEQAEKQSRTEFIASVGTFFKQAIPVARMVPQLVPAIGEMLMFLLRGYRAGRQVEDVVERALDELMDTARNQAQNPQPDPRVMIEQQKIALEKEKASQKLALDKMEAEHRMKLEERKLDLQRAAHNKALIDHAAGEIPMEAPSPLEQMIMQIGQIAQVQTQQGEQMKQLMMLLAAPKQAVRGPDGKIQAMVPVLPNQGAAIQ